MTALHSLPEVAAMWGLGAELKEPVRWLTRRITSGKMRARKIGRNWYMTDADLDYNLQRLANVVTASPPPPETEPTVAPASELPAPIGLSARSARRRMAVAR